MNTKWTTTNIREDFICTTQKKSTWDYVAYCIYSQTSHSAEISLYSKQMLFW